MNKLSYILLLILGLAFTLNAQSQSKDTSFFINPLGTPLYLSGNFGEIRTNHFHSGIDIKTGGVIGKKVYAVADGYVSRIKISHTGYGRTIYITHPNGYVSVYAHLHIFNDKIETYIKNIQYKNENFNIDTPISSWILPVKKGEVIAQSGNSGYSGGPHLHFEIRNAKTEAPINPLKFDFSIYDTQKPIIQAIKVYAMDTNSGVNGKRQNTRLVTNYQKNMYYLRNTPLLKLSGDIGFSILTFDYTNGSWNKCGVYSIELWVDSTLIYKHQLDQFNFFETRYINSFVDFYEKKVRKRSYQKSFIDANNKLGIYTKSVNTGIFNFKPDQFYEVTYIVKDVYLNTSKLRFKVQGAPTLPHIQKQDTNAQQLSYNKANSINDSNFVFYLPPDALYSNIDFSYKVLRPTERTVSNIIDLHNNYTPIHLYCDLKIKVNEIPDSLQKKLSVVLLKKNNRIDNAFKTKYENNFAKARVRKLGRFSVMVDTVPPSIRPLNIYNNKNMMKTKSIKFSISDNISGIKNYVGKIDGEWVLFEYNGRYKILKYFFDEERLIKNKNHKLELMVEDEVGNNSFFNANFFW